MTLVPPEEVQVFAVQLGRSTEVDVLLEFRRFTGVEKVLSRMRKLARGTSEWGRASLPLRLPGTFLAGLTTLTLMAALAGGAYLITGSLLPGWWGFRHESLYRAIFGVSLGLPSLALFPVIRQKLAQWRAKADLKRVAAMPESDTADAILRRWDLKRDLRLNPSPEQVERFFCAHLPQAIQRQLVQPRQQKLQEFRTERWRLQRQREFRRTTKAGTPIEHSIHQLDRGIDITVQLIGNYERLGQIAVEMAARLRERRRAAYLIDKSRRLSEEVDDTIARSDIQTEVDRHELDGLMECIHFELRGFPALLEVEPSATDHLREVG